jgi:hypothetical protein
MCDRHGSYVPSSSFAPPRRCGFFLNKLDMKLGSFLLCYETVPSSLGPSLRIWAIFPTAETYRYLEHSQNRSPAGGRSTDMIHSFIRIILRKRRQQTNWTAVRYLFGEIECQLCWIRTID